MNPDIDQLKSDIADLQNKWNSLTLSSGIPREVETAFKTRLGTGNTTQAFPIGAIYFNATNVNPATELGYGTWSLISQGQMPVGYKSGDADFGTMAATGGAKTVTLTLAQTPAHTHGLLLGQTGSGNPAINSSTGLSANSYDETFMSSKGGGGSHNNLPPFYVLAVWQRTA